MKVHPLIEYHRRPKDVCYIHRDTPCNCTQIDRMTPEQVRAVMEDWIREWLEKKERMKARHAFGGGKLTMLIAADIRHRRMLGQSQGYIARKLSLSQATISKVFRHSDDELMLPVS